MAVFEKALEKLLKTEGGYVNDKYDSGGETIYGISRKNFPKWEGWKYVDKGDFKTAQIYVGEFYKKNFWEKCGANDAEEQELAEKLFDISVNMGVGKAVSFLQRGLNALNNVDLVRDGSYGPASRKELKACKYPDILLKILKSLQGARYVEITENNKSQRRFIKGWMRRV